jgi:hypothetical protein
MMHMKNYTVLAAVLCMQSTLFGFDKKTAVGSAATAGLLLLGAYEQHQSSKANAAIFWTKKAEEKAKAKLSAAPNDEVLALECEALAQRLIRLERSCHRHDRMSKIAFVLAAIAGGATYVAAKKQETETETKDPSKKEKITSEQMVIAFTNMSPGERSAFIKKIYPNKSTQVDATSLVTEVSSSRSTQTSTLGT